MAVVKVDICGIAMSYHKSDEIWKVIFPFNSCHTVKFKTKDDENGTALAQANRQIKITAVNPVSKFNVGESYEKFLDMTGEHSHSGGVRMKSDWQENGVVLTIENADFSVKDMTKSRYRLKDDQGRVTMPSAKIGHSGTAVIEAEKVIVEVNGRGGFTKTFEEDGTITFDNDCRIETARNTSDFQMLYRVISDRNTADRKFTLERDPQDDPGNSNAAGDKGNMGIMNTNPTPGEDGLPCNKVRISNPEDLP